MDMDCLSWIPCLYRSRQATSLVYCNRYFDTLSHLSVHNIWRQFTNSVLIIRFIHWRLPLELYTCLFEMTCRFTLIRHFSDKVPHNHSFMHGLWYLARYVWSNEVLHTLSGDTMRSWWFCTFNHNHKCSKLGASTGWYGCWDQQVSDCMAVMAEWHEATR